MKYIAEYNEDAYFIIKENEMEDFIEKIIKETIEIGADIHEYNQIKNMAYEWVRCLINQGKIRSVKR